MRARAVAAVALAVLPLGALACASLLGIDSVGYGQLDGSAEASATSDAAGDATLADAIAPPDAAPFDAPPAEDATVLIGDKALGSSLDDQLAPGLAEAFSATAVATGTVGRIYVYVTQEGATSLQAGLYQDKLGRPGDLLSQGTITGVVLGWNVVPLDVPTAVAANTTNLWIALGCPQGGPPLHFKSTNGVNLSLGTLDAATPPLPRAWPANANLFTNSPVLAFGAP